MTLMTEDQIIEYWAEAAHRWFEEDTALGLVSDTGTIPDDIMPLLKRIPACGVPDPADTTLLSIITYRTAIAANRCEADLNRLHHGVLSIAATPGVKFPEQITLDTIVKYRAAIAIEWIRQDIRLGIQPVNIRTFSDLHNNFDANMYLLDEAHPEPLAQSFYNWPELDVQGVCDQFNRVMDIINLWLAEQQNQDMYRIN